MKIICQNKKAYHNFHVEDKVEAGISLLGSEVKSLRENGGSLSEAYVVFNQKQELFLKNLHISVYQAQANFNNHDPLRSRKLLLNKVEINKIIQTMTKKSRSCFPTKMYFKKGLVKVEIALGVGKKKQDKRMALKEKQDKKISDSARFQSRR